MLCLAQAVRCQPGSQSTAAWPRDWCRKGWGPRGGRGRSGQALTQTSREEGRPCSSRQSLEGVGLAAGGEGRSFGTVSPAEAGGRGQGKGALLTWDCARSLLGLLVS